jgi:hypothetical protein
MLCQIYSFDYKNSNFYVFQGDYFKICKITNFFLKLQTNIITLTFFIKFLHQAISNTQ